MNKNRLKLLLSRKVSLSIVAGLIFFVAALLTLPNYGISWDEPTHFKRGQAYLWFMLTGDNNYEKLPDYDLERAQTDPDYHERSFYHDDTHNAAFYRTIDGGHPPLSDIFASATNLIFYQKLGILGDVESYHLFEIAVASLSVGFIFLYVYENFGFWAAFLSSTFYATYPLFWAESHFNIKDPVETSWIVVTLYFFWNGVVRISPIYLILSSVFAGLALGTKLNVVFLPLAVLPWMFYLFKSKKIELKSLLGSKHFLLACFLFPVITFSIFYFFYPFLWDDPIVNIGKVLTYYERTALDPSFANAVLSSWKLYAVRWVLLTTPPLVLLGLALCVFHLRKHLRHKNAFLFFVILWFLVPILRVSIPGVNIYGGVRQIMEYIPAASILAGVGIFLSIEKIKAKKAVFVVVALFALIISLTNLYRLHPNENVYFNFLTGGLGGAVESGVPAAGNSFGNTYYQGLMWVNENADRDAKLTIVQGTPVNIPKYKVRSDIDLSGDHFSGINLGGEYIMALVYNYEHRDNFYAWEYVNKFLVPVYEIEVDGAVILKIWKNDLEHTAQGFGSQESTVEIDRVSKIENGKIEISLNKTALLTRLVFKYSDFPGCVLPKASTVETSNDGKSWRREGDPFGFAQIGKPSGSFSPVWVDSEDQKSTDKEIFLEKVNTIEYYFAGRKAKHLRVNTGSSNACILNNIELKIFAIEK